PVRRRFVERLGEHPCRDVGGTPRVTTVARHVDVDLHGRRVAHHRSPVDAGRVEVGLHRAVPGLVDDAFGWASTVEAGAAQCDASVGQRGAQHGEVRADRVDELRDGRERPRAQFDLPAGLDGDTATARQRRAGGSEGELDLRGGDAASRVVDVMGEPFQLEPDGGAGRGFVDGPITDDGEGVARGQAPRGRRHGGYRYPKRAATQVRLRTGASHRYRLP